jgi:plasmid stabilization system protein ParE
MDSRVYARNTVRNIVEKTSNLTNNPQIGRIVPELENSDIREVFIYAYRIIIRFFPILSPF